MFLFIRGIYEVCLSFCSKKYKTLNLLFYCTKIGLQKNKTLPNLIYMHLEQKMHTEKNIWSRVT